MKKIISICSAFLVAASAFATGNEGVNLPQIGTSYVTNGVSAFTNTFAFPFQNTPLVVVYSSLTNGSPTTNTFVTTTNFATSFPPGGTNAAFTWSAFVGGTKMAFGTATNAAASATSVLFPFTYASPPSVVLTGNTTNAFVQSTSITNFVILGQAVQTNGWISIGAVYNPQSENQGVNPPNNKVLTP